MMTPTEVYAHPTMTAGIVVHHNDEWFYLPNTLTTPAVNWGQRRKITAQQPELMTRFADNSLTVRMLLPVMEA